MRKIILFTFVAVFSVSVNFAFAQALIPFGGRVVTAPIPSAFCPDVDFAPEDPFIILPVGSSAVPPPIPGPFQQTLAPSYFTQFGLIAPGAWILGLYLPSPIPDCTVGVPPVISPLPVFKAVQWGTSIPLPI